MRAVLYLDRAIALQACAAIRAGARVTLNIPVGNESDLAIALQPTGMTLSNVPSLELEHTHGLDAELILDMEQRF